MDHQKLAEIDSRIHELRNLLVQLEEASEALRQQGQHEAVDHLEDYMDATDVDVTNIALFKEEALNELKALLQRLKNLIPHG
ncbi:hypothetical protein VV869_19450 [Photobacterium sp. MCCC 1A19761]|uniref:hypothetical protein n=1 Tax=Photobacterium sp. MCCC 1A19761 TaxID=3115000 RepID=UPI00307F0A90